MLSVLVLVQGVVVELAELHHDSNTKAEPLIDFDSRPPSADYPSILIDASGTPMYERELSQIVIQHTAQQRLSMSRDLPECI